MAELTLIGQCRVGGRGAGATIPTSYSLGRDEGLSTDLGSRPVAISQIPDDEQSGGSLERAASAAARGGIGHGRISPHHETALGAKSQAAGIKAGTQGLNDPTEWPLPPNRPGRVHRRLILYGYCK